MKNELYWLEMSGLTAGQKPTPIEIKQSPEVEGFWLEMCGLPRLDSPNPVNYLTKGKDQEMKPLQLGNTFTPEEIEELAGMKLKLHALGDKALAADAEEKPEKAEKIRKQIEKLSAEIDHFSDMLNLPLEEH